MNGDQPCALCKVQTALYGVKRIGTALVWKLPGVEVMNRPFIAAS
jgi:hypothetical protein